MNLSVNYQAMVAPLIEATKEQQNIIDKQARELETQKKLILDLKESLERLSRKVDSLEK